MGQPGNAPSMNARLRTRTVHWALLALMTIPTSLRGQGLYLERMWELGTVDGPPETIWSRIADATIMAGGVYAVDVAIPAARAFEITGEFRGELGGVGQGPGEFARPLSVFARGDTLAVYDVALRRTALFDVEGEHLKTLRTAAGSEPHGLERVWTAEHGWNVGRSLIIGRSRPESSVTDLYTVAWRPSERLDTLLTVASNAVWVRDGPNDPTLRVLTVYNLGPEGGSWLLGDSLLATLNARESLLRFWHFTPMGPEVIAERSLGGERRRLTAADRRAASDWLDWKYGISPEDTDLEYVFPEWWSPWTAVLGDSRGHIWIRRGGPRHVDQEAGEQWLRLSLDEQSAVELETPVGVEVLRIRDGYVVGKRTGAHGVEHLVLYRLVASPTGGGS